MLLFLQEIATLFCKLLEELHLNISFKAGRFWVKGSTNLFENFYKIYSLLVTFFRLGGKRIREQILLQISVYFVGFVTLSPGENSLKEAVEQHEAPKQKNDNLYGSTLSEADI